MTIGYTRTFNPNLHPRVLGFYPDALALSYFRMVWPYQYLQAAGYPVAWAHSSQFDARDGRGNPIWLPYDLLVFQRLWQNTEQGFQNFLRLREEFGKCLVWEFDDHPFEVPPWNPAHRDISPEQVRFVEATMRAVDAITTTNQHLASFFRQYNPNVWVIPNGIFHEAYNLVQPEDRKVPGLTIGLAGGFNHYEDWRIVLEPLKQILTDYPNVTFVPVGHCPNYFDELPQDRIYRGCCRDCEPNDWPRLLCNVDIGLAPLVDIPFNHCKSPIKVQEYSLVGAASVCSPIVYPSVVRHGENGLIAHTLDDWYASIAKLVDQPKERERLATTMRREVLRSHTVRARAPMWWKTYSLIYQKFMSTRARVQDSKPKLTLIRP